MNIKRFPWIREIIQRGNWAKTCWMLVPSKTRARSIPDSPIPTLHCSGLESLRRKAPNQPREVPNLWTLYYYAVCIMSKRITFCSYRLFSLLTMRPGTCPCPRGSNPFDFSFTAFGYITYWTILRWLQCVKNTLVEDAVHPSHNKPVPRNTRANHPSTNQVL